MTQAHPENLDQKTTEEKVSSRVSPWLARLIYPLGCRIVIPLYFGQMEVTGREHIPSSGPVIVAPTHRSRWDALIVPYAVGRWVSGRDLHFMVSANEAAKGLQGWVIRRMGGFPVDTERPDLGSLRHSVELLLEDKMLVIFPEGNIFRDQQIHPLKRGIARIALEVEDYRPGNGIKILPLSIKYSQTYPSWGCDVRVDIGPSLEVAKYSSPSARKSSQQLTADLKAALKALYEDQPEPAPVCQ